MVGLKENIFPWKWSVHVMKIKQRGNILQNAAKFATLHNNRGITTCILDQACQQSTQHLHAIMLRHTYVCNTLL